MPCVILLDVSLSMTRPVSWPDCNQEYQRRNLATHGVNGFLDYLSAHNKLEFVSLVVFSSLWEQLVHFTRDYDSVRQSLTAVEEYNKTCIETALGGVNSIVIEEWGVTTPIQVLLITDGSTGVGEGSLKHSLATLHREPQEGRDKFPLPFPFKCKLHILCISPQNDSSLAAAMPSYQKLIDLNGGEGEIFFPEGQLSLKSTQAMFTKLSEKFFSPMDAAICCGNLKCNIQLFPAPSTYDRDHDFEHIKCSIRTDIQICGFLDIADVSSPPFLSRHLVLPKPVETPASGSDGGKEEEEESEEGKMAAFTVLLHGALKVEGMVAIVQLQEDWYGMMYSWADSKKKSNLMLSLFTPGSDILPWLGNLNNLAPIEDFSSPPYGEDDNKSPFPVRPTERRSYAQNCVVWIKTSGLQADIQKILRNARKLPEKQQHFYKELNRVRKAALSFGFYDLLDAIAQLLERECTMLPGNAHPDAAMQLTHAANALQGENAKDITVSILPLRTNFSGDS